MIPKSVFEQREQHVQRTGNNRVLDDLKLKKASLAGLRGRRGCGKKWSKKGSGQVLCFKKLMVILTVMGRHGSVKQEVI